MIEVLKPTEIPEPEETGSSGTQGVGEIVPTVKESPLKGLPIAQAFEGLVTTRPKSFGGEVAANLIVGAFHQYGYDLETLRREMENNRKELKQTLIELYEVKTKAAVLQERVNGYKREKHLKNLSITAGTAMIGIGIQFIRSNFDNYGYIACILGILLLFFGWVSKSEEAGK